LSNHPTERFNRIMLPHLDAAYNLARWLTRNSDETEDIVQESFIKAFRHFNTFRGENSRSWLLAIVRNNCYDWLKAQKRHSEIRMAIHAQELDAPTLQHNPEISFFNDVNRAIIDKALAELPVEFREAIVLRELEDCSYQEISAITGAPLGTVMSRLARGRSMLRDKLAAEFCEKNQ